MYETHEIVVALNRLKDQVAELSFKVQDLAKSPAQQMNKKFMNTEEAANALRISTRTLAKMRKEGDLNYMIIRRKIMYKYSDIYEFMEKNFFRKR